LVNTTVDIFDANVPPRATFRKVAWVQTIIANNGSHRSEDGAIAASLPIHSAAWTGCFAQSQRGECLRRAF